MSKSFEQSHSKEKMVLVDTLEIAAGNFSLIREIGRVGEECGEEIDFGKNVIVTDIDEDNLRYSREDFEYDKEDKPGLSFDRNFSIIDNAKMPFVDSSVKRVFCSNFFSSQQAMGVGLWQQPGKTRIKEFLQEIHRVLIPGGFLVIHDTLSPEISDQLIEDGYFSKGFKDVSEDGAEIFGVSPTFFSQVKNKYGEYGNREIKIFRKE